MEILEPEHFRKNVEEMEEKYGIMNCVYVKCVEEFNRLKLSEVNESHRTRIIEPFLFDWGKMQRWLGYNGIEKVVKRLKRTPLLIKWNHLEIRA